MATKEQQQSFIDRFLPVARQIESIFGIPVSVTLGQAALESGWGTSGAATRDNNYFGIKAKGNAGTRTHVSKEYEDGKWIDRSSSFGAYTSPEDSFFAYGELISGAKRYKGAFDTSNSYEFVSAVRRAGYATDPTYATKVHDIMRGHQLTQLDGGFMGPPSPDKSKGRIIQMSNNTYPVSTPDQNKGSSRQTVTPKIQIDTRDQVMWKQPEFIDALRIMKDNSVPLSKDGIYEFSADSPFIDGNEYLTSLALIAWDRQSDINTGDLTREFTDKNKGLNFTGNIVRIVVLLLLVIGIIVMVVMTLPKNPVGGAVSGALKGATG